MISPPTIFLFPPGASASDNRPPSLWRIQRAMLDSMACAVLGPVPICNWTRKADRLQRHFCDSPRRRSKQTTWKNLPRIMDSHAPPTTPVHNARDTSHRSSSKPHRLPASLGKLAPAPHRTALYPAHHPQVG